jgi:hypothetical protein
MKQTLLIIFLTFSSFTFSQNLSDALEKWIFFSSGNPIDGYNRQSMRINDTLVDTNLYLLKVTNSAELIKLKNSMGEGENDRDDLFITLKSLDTLNSFYDLDEVLMYFDNDESYYKVSFKAFEESKLLWVNAVENKDTKFLGKFDFVKKLKQQATVTFRLVFTEGKSEDITFQLNGSKISLDQTVDLSNFNKDDLNMDSMYGLFSIALIKNEEKLKTDLLDLNISEDNFNKKLYHYLEEKLGKFYLTLISEIEYLNDILYINNFNDKVILKVNIKKDLL